MTTSMDTSTLALQPLASPTGNTTDEPNSNSSKTTSLFQPNSLSATGTTTTQLTNSPPYSSPPKDFVAGVVLCGP